MTSTSGDKAPPVRAIAALLADVEPQALAQLRAEFPEQKHLFDPHYRLGYEPSTPASVGPTLEAQALRSFAEVGLTAAERKLEQLIAALIKKMKLARFVKLTGAIVASVSSVGVISALALDQREAELVAALVGLTSSVTALIGEHLNQSLVGSQKSL